MPFPEIRLPANAGETARFAAEELRKFLAQLRPVPQIVVTMRPDPALGPGAFDLAGQGRYTLTGGDEPALLYGVYALLQAFGFRFFGPDPWDTVMPVMPRAIIASLRA